MAGAVRLPGFPAPPDDAFGAGGPIPAEALADIIRAGARMDSRGWVPATAGNISVRFGAGRIAITRSGVHKGYLTEADVMEVGVDGRALTEGRKPSAETLLHCQILERFPDVHAVLHGHSIAGTVLSMVEESDALVFTGYELFKAFAGQVTHDTSLALPVFPNDQDIGRLAALIAPHLGDAPVGYYIRGHGVYVWAPSMDIALARLEAIEFLLDCELQRRQLTRR